MTQRAQTFGKKYSLVDPEARALLIPRKLKTLSPQKKKLRDDNEQCDRR